MSGTYRPSRLAPTSSRHESLPFGCLLSELGFLNVGSNQYFGACRGVTDELLALVATAERRASSVLDQLAAVRDRHAELAAAVLDAEDAAACIEEIDGECPRLWTAAHS